MIDGSKLPPLEDLSDLSRFGDIGTAVMAVVKRLEALEKQTRPKPADFLNKDLTMRELAQELNKNYYTVYRMVKRGLIPADRSSRSYRFTRKNVDEFKRRNTW